MLFLVYRALPPGYTCMHSCMHLLLECRVLEPFAGRFILILRIYAHINTFLYASCNCWMMHGNYPAVLFFFPKTFDQCNNYTCCVSLKKYYIALSRKSFGKSLKTWKSLWLLLHHSAAAVKRKRVKEGRQRREGEKKVHEARLMFHGWLINTIKFSCTFLNWSWFSRLLFFRWLGISSSI